MTKKEAEALREEIAALKKKVEAIEKEPRKYEFHYHPPLFVRPYSPPWPPLPWWSGGTICGGSSGNTTMPNLGPYTVTNRLENTCVN